MNPLIAIVGPTATGKSALAIYLAQVCDGEIVSADSCQVYRYMDIGTAKPTLEERSMVPHHLVDVVDPDQAFSLALYQELAYQAIDDIHQRGRLAILVGGSGLYIHSIVNGYRIPQVTPDYELRHNLEKRARLEGGDILFRELEKIDLVAAQHINPKNIRRVIRAIEVFHLTGQPFSKLQKNELPPFDILTIGLTAERTELYRRIDNRVDNMIKQGLVAEVSGLRERGYSFELPSMSSVGYRQIGDFLRGETTLAEAAQQIKYQTHRFARHQYAWFRPKDASIKWFDIKENIEKRVENLVTGFVSR